MARMQTGRKNGNGDGKKHIIIDKNCVYKVLQNNKVLESYKIPSKKECEIMRQKIDTKIDKEGTGHQIYKSIADKPKVQGKLSDTHITRLRKDYRNAKQVGAKTAKNYLNSLPAQAQEQLRKFGIK